eukprot:NODE_5566_length_567_cov_19.515444_g4835_i0.p1 GENE.NODE_5566_length_567_cov_19.515444_g4835_i0~~NODE_5566_length_567_cov_19.515444_g4835_i0.p1  ORF type:complete len:109 (-),score=39.70 NODE_5566_length_567_cov_19.515444_g4835_i0:240-539(-)
MGAAACKGCASLGNSVLAVTLVKEGAPSALCSAVASAARSGDVVWSACEAMSALAGTVQGRTSLREAGAIQTLQLVAPQHSGKTRALVSQTLDRLSGMA